uniref:Uncharacterized protein n=1 Tax=Anguilla anguilla TaxID=7936 RepID=A0A0E9VQX5_ANGAN
MGMGGERLKEKTMDGYFKINTQDSSVFFVFFSFLV